MRHELADILSDKQQPVTNKQLVDYLSGKLDEAEQHEVEKVMAASQMDDDAFEGLQLLANKEKISQYQADISKGLHEKLKQKKQERKRPKLPQLQWTILVTVGLLSLIFLAWFIVHWLKTKG